MCDKNSRGYLAVVIIVSLIVGGFAGAFGSFFIAPSLEKTNWGKQFLGTNAPEQSVNQKKVISVEENSATIEAVKKVSPSVVSVVVTKELESFYNLTGPDVFNFWNFGTQIPQGNGKKEKKEIGGGTGFVIGADGLILTNKHVVADEQAEYSVLFSDGKRYEAKVLGRDTVYDVAVLKIDAKNLAVAEIGDSDKIEIGQTVIAIGNALSEYSNSVTRGVVSGINRKVIAGDSGGGSEVIQGAIQTDAAINPGNSGGPLLNLAGQVIGVNTAVNWQGQSLGFAIPINQAKSVIESVKQFGKIVRPWLGVRYIQLNEEIAKANNLKYNYGAMVLQGQNKTEPAVVAASPAEKAGIKENDIILEVNGEKLDDDSSLVQEISKYKPGNVIILQVAREDKVMEIKVKLEERRE
ncbi:trypsin-like peptidase domain-containing protein [Candidatus Falkowbacteria bacterium]|nr:trypsin-like peptidase domain-containing protein [Candidatus Falkowbacteria bacterium]